MIIKTHTSITDIVFDARMYNNSGIGTYIRNLVGQYAKSNLNQDITLLTDGDVNGLGFTIKRCSYKIYGLAEQTFLPYIVRKASLLHTPHYNAPVLFQGKLVVTIHDLIHLTFYDQLPSLFHKVYAKVMMGMVIKRANAIITVSEWTKNDICIRWPQAVHKIKTIYNGISIPVNHINPKEVLVKYGIDKPYIFYVGLLKRHKNLMRLVESFLAAQRSLKGEYLLVIAGDVNSDDVNLKQYLDDCPAKQLIRLTGFVPEADLPALYSQAAVFAFPSIAEGFGLPPLEAMSYGIPVISSNATCLPEVLKDAPMYFDPYDTKDLTVCLERALADDAWRQAAIRRGRDVSAGYRWDKTARECLKIYNSLLS